jgi:hypothetical protein
VKQEISRAPAAGCLIIPYFLFVFLLDHEHGGDIFLRNSEKGSACQTLLVGILVSLPFDPEDVSDMLL